MIEASQITRTMLPIIILNWVAGIGVIEYPLGKPYPTISLIFSLILLVAYYALTAIAYPYLFTTTFIYNYSKKPVVCMFYCNLLLAFNMKKLTWHSWKGMSNYTKNSATVDNLMQHIGIRLNYRKMLSDHTRTIISSVSLIIALLWVNAYLMISLDTSKSIRILITSILAYPVIMVSISDLTFITCINFLRHRFYKLNKFLQSALIFDSETPCHTQMARLCKNQRIRVNGLNNVEKVYPGFMILAKKIHLQLIKTCQETDHLYAMNILQSTAVTFILLTAKAYVAYRSIFMEKRADANLTKEIAFWILWTCFYLIKTFLFSVYCHRCEQQSILTGNIINKMYDEPWVSNQTRSEIRDFNMQLIQNRLEFLAGGFITLDLSLLQVMIHTITTYLVIIIQLGQVYSKDSCDKISFTNALNMTARAH